MLVGGMMALGILSASFLNAPKAHAADRSWGNIDIAQKVIKEVAPIVSQDFKADEVNASLALKADNFIQKPIVVETQVTPEPPKPRPVIKPVQPKVAPARVASAAQARPSANVGHIFPYGYCTYYVAQKRVVPWSGNAGTWLTGAKKFGFATGSTPQVGAIMVTSESPVGHVAYVEKVSGNQITVSEMNYTGFARTSTRTLSASSGFIKGFIY